MEQLPVRDYPWSRPLHCGKSPTPDLTWLSSRPSCFPHTFAAPLLLFQFGCSRAGVILTHPQTARVCAKQLSFSPAAKPTTQVGGNLRAAQLVGDCRFTICMKFIRGLWNSFLTKKMASLVCAGEKEERLPRHVCESACSRLHPCLSFECVHLGVVGQLWKRKPVYICAAGAWSGLCALWRHVV